MFITLFFFLFFGSYFHENNLFSLFHPFMRPPKVYADEDDDDDEVDSDGERVTMAPGDGGDKGDGVEVKEEKYVEEVITKNAQGDGRDADGNKG